MLNFELFEFFKKNIIESLDLLLKLQDINSLKDYILNYINELILKVDILNIELGLKQDININLKLIQENIIIHYSKTASLETFQYLIFFELKYFLLTYLKFRLKIKQ